MKKIAIIIFILLFGANMASAQLNLGGFNVANFISLADEMTADIIPTYPRPNSEVFIDLRMYSENLNSAMIVWVKDNKEEAEGRGLTSFNFTTGKPGSITRIKINVTLQSGTSFSKEVIIRPATIDVLWQSDSYVPPFYQGKALFPPQGNVIFSAIPEVYGASSKIDPSRLVYKWTVNDEVDERQSGYGKRAILVTGPILGLPIEVGVVATDPISNATAENFLTINPTDPQIVFYQNSPLYGIVFEKAINGGVELAGEEMSVLAVPFYVNVEDNPLYQWSMNGKSAPEVVGLSATFRKPEDMTGSTILSLKAENQNRILQFTENGFRINYRND